MKSYRNGSPRGKRPPDSTVDQRIAEMCDALANRPSVHRCELHSEFCKKWRVHWRTIDRIVVRARENLLVRLQRSKKEFKADSLAFYESVIQDPKASTIDKLRACQRKDDLLGLDEAKVTQISGPDGGPIQSESTFRIEKPLSREIANKMLEILERGAKPTVDAKLLGNGHAE